MSAPSTPGGGLRVVTHERRMELRELNLRAKSNRPCTNLISACNSIDVGEEDLSHLDSSLKKITTFIRRLKNITFDNYQSILDEYDQLKLSKYIAEVNVALLENKLKTAADIWALVEVG